MDAPEKADLILVLGGDFFGQRVLEGAQLGREGYAPKVLISGPYYKGRPEGDLAAEFAAESGYSLQLFETFAHTASSTFDEAIALGPLFRKRGVRQVLLVTSRYHTRRAGIIFRCIYPRIRFLTIGPRHDPFDPHNWRRQPQVEAVVRSEWLKLVWNIGIRCPAYHLVGYSQ